MAILFYFFTIYINALLFLNKKYSKAFALLTILIILLLMTGAGPEYSYVETSLDYLNYLTGYNNMSHINFDIGNEVGYVILVSIGNLLNINFFYFRLIVLTVCMLFIYKNVILKYSKNPNLVLLFYISYNMIIDSEQLRNFIGMTILVSSMYLLLDDKRRNRFRFLINILIASTFHTAFILYIPLVLVNWKDGNKIIKGLVVLALLLSLIIIINDNQVPFLNLTESTYHDNRLEYYLSRSTNMGFLIPMLLQLLNIRLVNWSKKLLNYQEKTKINNKLLNTPTTTKFSNLVYWLNIYGLFLFPFFIVSIHFYRLIRNFMILNYILYSLVFSELVDKIKLKILFGFSVVGSILLWGFLDLVIITGPEKVLFPFFFQNLFS